MEKDKVNKVSGKPNMFKRIWEYPINYEKIEQVKKTYDNFVTKLFPPSVLGIFLIPFVTRILMSFKILEEKTYNSIVTGYMTYFVIIFFAFLPTLRNGRKKRYKRW